ncbi:hypothetical protein [Fictibacillus arsenicus]|uniref:Uncharacterized protein n=1 Tax=Fictibacillus arsenicus TaxID=255247 RepID=A0A1V3GB12_9BACL|nr:hypothetical protein [Fictibacillus arsenicus]OOE14056.1 hypothetical protein UN64_02250 [Fictibacillus arsenicus]
MEKKEFDQELLLELKEDLKMIKSLLSKYENLIEGITVNKKLRVYDVLTFDEKVKLAELELELLTAHSKKEATLIKKEIDLLLETANLRYMKSRGNSSNG